MTDELRQRIIERLKRGEDLPREWAREIFPPEKMEYELVYHGKEREGDILANTMAVPLQEVRTFGKNDGDWHNMIILGDNLQVLKRLLEYKKEGRLCNADGTPGVRLIYIDPPFATKQDFKGSQDQKAYRDKIMGAQFVEFLRKRLILLQELLSDDGSIYVHLDTRKSHYIKVVMDEVFGESSFRTEVVWYYRKYQMRGMRVFANNSERLLWYAKSAQANYIYNPQTIPLDKPKYLKRKKWDKDLSRIVNVRDDEGNLIYDEYSDEKVDDVWDIPFMGATSPERTGYPTQKPETVLVQVLKVSSNPGDLILDAFAGSGTTLAAAERLGRRWIGIDRGKLSIYTIQRRILNLKIENGKKSKPLTPKPFTLYNAGLYDFATLKKLPREDWRFFALQLFECKDEPHTIGGLKLDGKRRGGSVLVYDHHGNPDAKIDEDAILSIHRRIGDRISRQLYIIAPRHTFAFQQDYLTFDGVRYYALRIPYSFINELHRREFSALQQPQDETAVNDLIDAEGFDFIQPPTVKYKAGVKKRPGQLLKEAFIKLETFESKARVRGGLESRGIDAFSMLLLDLDYNGEVFQLHTHLYANDIAASDWYAWLPVEAIGEKIMAVFMDIYGNEATRVITRDELKLSA